MHESKLKGANHQVDQLRAKLNRVNHHALYWEKRVAEITTQQRTTKKSHLHYIEQLKREALFSLELDNAEMAETLESVLTDTEVHAFEGGRYTNDVRTCNLDLQGFPS